MFASHLKETCAMYHQGKGNEQFWGRPEKPLGTALSEPPSLLMLCSLLMEEQPSHCKTSLFLWYWGLHETCMGNELLGESLRTSFLGAIVCGQPELAKKVRRLSTILTRWARSLLKDLTRWTHLKANTASGSIWVELALMGLAMSTALQKNRTTVAGLNWEAQPGTFLV